ncbi:hypothetical protein, partial [Mycobacterium tuberculosis]|uniref:hypothetical protein n=1 Tax=Mycobacterium tuberculosis TaxID=1773 RepID=UPI001F281CFC
MTAPSWPPSAQPADASTNTVHTPATRLALRGLNPVSLDVNAPRRGTGGTSRRQLAAQAAQGRDGVGHGVAR